MELNLFTITYLFLRLAPFILVCFFVFSSFFNQDFKGIVYLIGLIITGFVTIMFETTGLLSRYKSDDSLKSPSCHAFKFSLLGFETSNSLPMSQNIFGFTFGYLLTIIYQNKLYWSNLPTLIFFPAITLFDYIWNIKNACYSWQYLLASLCIGLTMGNAWAWLIKRTKNEKLLYFNFVGGSDTCNKPSEQTFKCSMKLFNRDKNTPK